MILTVSSRSEHAIEETAGAQVFLRKPVTEESVSQAVQALGFVVTTMNTGDRLERVIEPRYGFDSAGR